MEKDGVGKDLETSRKEFEAGADKKPETETKQTVKEQLEALNRLEKTTGSSGAVPLMPKEQMLDLSEAQAKNPDHHLRWVNTRLEEKVTGRQMEGYTKLAKSDGGKKLGNLEVFAMPKERHAERVEIIRKRTAERLEGSKKEVEATAEHVAKILQDRHGIRVDAGRLLIRDE